MKLIYLLFGIILVAGVDCVAYGLILWRDRKRDKQ